MKIQIQADKGFDLQDIYDRIKEGELGADIAIPDIEIREGRAPFFAASDKPIETIKLHFKEKPTDELIAHILAELRMLVGDKAHIERIG